MSSKDTSANPFRSAPATAVSETRQEACACDVKVAVIRDCIMKGKSPAIPPELQDDKELREILDYIQTVQKGLAQLAKGDLSGSVPLKGYTGGMVKAVQSNLRHVLWKAGSIASGDFSQQIDFMGDVSAAFNSMVNRLNAAHSSLEEQRQHLVELSEELRLEVEARKTVEADLRREEERLQKLASSDVLTGISNRRYFFELASREVERMRRTGSVACVAMLDLDFFKQINDNFGHRQGDIELRALADLIVKTTRPYDIPARYGGDEFVIFFPETTLENALAVMERLRSAVERDNAARSDSEPTISISGGVASLSLAGGDEAMLEEAIGRADKALYQSKNLGRNRISAA